MNEARDYSPCLELNAFHLITVLSVCMKNSLKRGIRNQIQIIKLP